MELFEPSSTIILDPNLPFALRSQIQMTMEEIDLLHRVPKQIQVRVIENTSRREEGSYDPLLLQIAISRYAVDPLGTFIHEYGHFLDNRQLQAIRNEYASCYESFLDPLVLACMASASVREMTGMLRYSRHRLSRADWNYLRNVTAPYELFARAYAQWVCTKSFNFLLQASLHRRIRAGTRVGGKLLRLQWEPDEFADIMKEIECVLRLKGLL